MTVNSNKNLSCHTVYGTFVLLMTQDESTTVVGTFWATVVQASNDGMLQSILQREVSNNSSVVLLVVGDMELLFTSASNASATTLLPTTDASSLALTTTNNPSMDPATEDETMDSSTGETIITTTSPSSMDASISNPTVITSSPTESPAIITDPTMSNPTTESLITTSLPSTGNPTIHPTPLPSAVSGQCSLCFGGGEAANLANTVGGGTANGVPCSELVNNVELADSDGCRDLQLLGYRYCDCPSYPTDYFCAMCDDASMDIPDRFRVIPGTEDTCEDLLFVKKDSAGDSCDDIQMLSVFCECPGIEGWISVTEDNVLVIGLSFLVSSTSTSRTDHSVDSSLLVRALEEFATTLVQEWIFRDGMHRNLKDHRRQQRRRLEITLVDGSVTVFDNSIASNSCRSAGGSTGGEDDPYQHCHQAQGKFDVRITADENESQVCRIMYSSVDSLMEDGYLQFALVSIAGVDSNVRLEPGSMDYCLPVSEFSSPPVSTYDPNAPLESTDAPSVLPAYSTTLSPTEAISSPQRLSEIKTFLIQQKISSEANLNQMGSAQYRALDFMAVGDEMAMAIPSGSQNSPDVYEFVTRYALSVLYFSTAGERWTYTLNFLVPTSVCQWYSVLQYADLSSEFRGVACDDEGIQVVALFLSKSYVWFCRLPVHCLPNLKSSFSLLPLTDNNNLAGALPAEIGLLTSLVNIDFDLNSLTGTIPDSFKALIHLESFVASGNDIMGTIPAWFDSVSIIRAINWSHNLLTGSLPRNLGNLIDVVALALDNNLCTGTLGDVFDSDQITGFRSLEQLYLKKNQFSGTLGQNFAKEVPKLAYLDISDNQLDGSIPSHLFGLPELIVLDLHDNGFFQLPPRFQPNNMLQFLALQKCKFEKQSIPSSIYNLESLMHLDLSQNKFTGAIPEIGLLKNLTYLFLAQNDFAPGDIPSWLQEFTMLEELSLKSTQREGAIPDFLGSSLSNLILLDLDANRLTGTIPESLGTLKDLVILLLNRNNLTSVIPTSFRNLQSLGEFGFLLACLLSLKTFPNFIALCGPLNYYYTTDLLYLEANTAISGSLGDLFCSNPTLAKRPIIVADCDMCDAFPGCCELCCIYGQECNDGVHVPDLDPIWQLGYQRKFFVFKGEDYFE